MGTKDRGSFVVAGAFGVLALGAAVATGYWNDHHTAHQANKVAIGAPMSERQALERRRARAAEVAIAGTTTL